MQGYTVVYSVFILAKQLNVIVLFSSVTFTFPGLFTLLSILRFQWPKLFFLTNQIDLVEKINQW